MASSSCAHADSAEATQQQICSPVVDACCSAEGQGPAADWLPGLQGQCRLWAFSCPQAIAQRPLWALRCRQARASRLGQMLQPCRMPAAHMISMQRQQLSAGAAMANCLGQLGQPRPRRPHLEELPLPCITARQWRPRQPVQRAARRQMCSRSSRYTAQQAAWP